MKKLVLSSCLILFLFELISSSLAGEQVLNSVELIEKWGYPAEQHNVTTEDGYILNIFRIPWSPVVQNKNAKKPVIFLQGPLLSASDVWLILGPNTSLAKQLADKGYDVWIGNYRGSTYGRKHVTLSPSTPKFWDFSLHEAGVYDLPAMIDYVLKYTRQESLIYLGMSMGTTSFFIMTSERPEYNKKIQLFIAFCPVAGLFGKSKEDTYFFTFMATLVNAVNPTGNFEALPQSSLYKKLGNQCLQNNIISLCLVPFDKFFGADRYQLDYNRFISVFSNFPTGTSGKILLHYEQFAQYRTFQQFDYENYEKNIEHYDRSKPPSYNLRNFNVSTLYFYGENDPLSRAEDAREIVKRSSSKIIVEAVRYKHFNHLDFLFANDAKKLIYDRVVERLDQFAKRQIPEFF